MSFPIEVDSNIDVHGEKFTRQLSLRRGLTILIGPNGSGKTHFLKGMRAGLEEKIQGKKVRFLSAGRLGLFEQYRSNITGSRVPQYEDASFGNREEAKKRHLNETINGDFQTISERTDIRIKIQERLRKLFKRELVINWDSGRLKVSFVRLDNTSDQYSSGREASGILHLLGILSALYDDDVGALLLDEPEVSLHPQLQSFLLDEIYSVAGHPSEGGHKKIIVMATHSTEMIRISKINDLLSLAFCYDLDTNPIQLDPDSGVLKNNKIKGLIARLGQEHKLSFFSRRPLLVEGPSDIIICRFISNKLEYHLEAAGSQLLPVIGKGQMVVVSKLMRLLGKDPIVLADADALSDGLELANYFLSGSEIVNQKATQLGSGSAIKLAREIYSDFCQLVEDNWTDISAIAENHPYWQNRDQDSEETQAKRRSSFCTIYELDDSKIKELNNGDKWLNIKNRLSVILELLELAGCFILRKGAIESYYQTSDRLISEGKPSAAVKEVEHLSDFSNDKLTDAYNDVVRCIKFSSSGEIINEADALKDLLISIAAPSLARMGNEATTQDIQAIIASLFGDKSNIFNLSISDRKLIIELNSDILKINGFPIELTVEDNVVKVIEQVLRENN